MLDSDDGRTRVPEVPADAANCPSSLSISMNWKAWLSSRAKSACSTPISRRRINALVGCGLHQPMFESKAANAVHDRKDTTLLEVQRVAIARGCD